NQYRGFGGLKFILNPVKNPEDINQWRKSERPFFALTQELHRLLQEKATDEKQYRRFVDSMRSSVLSAFYTPPAIIKAISSVLKEHQLDTHKFLDPSAGIGSFLSSFSAPKKENNTAYEKDLLTGKILKQLYPQSTIRIKGFEEIPEKEQNSYDIVASNIPFGDTSVFDLSYSRSNDPAKIQAARSIHNYFFLKGTDMLREGGLLAFITSQGILNSPKNEPIRRALMQNNHLVSAIRLPNNLFTDYAGTEVGSDLIVLQKDTRKQQLSPREELFCQSMLTESNAPNNALFTDTTRIVHTDKKIATDPYGKPVLIYTHKEGVEGMAKSLKQMLLEDFDQTLSLELYQGKSSKEAIPQNTSSINGVSVVPPRENNNQKISTASIKKERSPEDQQ